MLGPMGEANEVLRVRHTTLPMQAKYKCWPSPQAIKGHISPLVGLDRAQF